MFRLLTAIVIVAGCAGAPPPPTLAERFPAKRFIVAEGRSDSGPDAARADARAQVAAQVRSALRSTLQVEVGEVGGDSYARATRSVVESTDFAHAELIDTEPARCVGSRCSAVAWLDRRRALDVLGTEYAHARPAFVEAAAAAEAAKADAIAFTPHFAQTDRSWHAIAPLGYQLRIIGRRPDVDFATDKASFRTLLGHRARLAAASRVTVVPGGVDEDLAASLQTALVGAFDQLGLPATSASGCQKGLVFEPTAVVRCGPGTLGPRCEMSVSGRLRACDGDLVAEFDLSSARVAGAHPISEAEARRALRKRITAKAFTAALAERLEDLLPIERERG